MIEFTTVQFLDMVRPARVSLITDCIERLNNSITIKIDEVKITEISEFVGWLLDNLNQQP